MYYYGYCRYNCWDIGPPSLWDKHFWDYFWINNDCKRMYEFYIIMCLTTCTIKYSPKNLKLTE